MLQFGSTIFFQSVQKSRGLKQIIFGLLVRTWKENTALKRGMIQLDAKKEFFWDEGTGTM